MPTMPATRSDHERNTAPAAEVNRLRFAKAAAEDPAKLARAVRIVRVGLEQGKLNPADLIDTAA